MPLATTAKGPTTVPGQGANLLATRTAAYETIQRTLDHLRPTLNGRAFYKHLKEGGRPAFFYPVPPPHPRYRIPFWNIAPGDQVRVKTNAMTVPSSLVGRVGTVLHVDRLYNRVYLKERAFRRLEIRDLDEKDRAPDGPDQVEVERHRAILYRDLQLIIGKYDLEVDHHVAKILRKTMPGRDNDTTRQLVALRMRTKGRRWDPHQLRFLWDRVPVHVRALKPGSGEIEPWLVPVPRDTVGSPKCPKRVPWTHEEGYAEGKPIEGTIKRDDPPPFSPVFDTSPADALRSTWEPPDLRALWSAKPAWSTLIEAMPEYQPRYDPEFGNLRNRRRRQRMLNQRIRYRVRRYLRSKRFGWIREKVEMPPIGGYRGPHEVTSKRPPNKQRARRIAQGKDPDVVFARETGLKNDRLGYGGRHWPL